MEWVIAFILIVGGAELANNDKKDNTEAEVREEVNIQAADIHAVEKDPIFARGRYYLDDNGYFVSDLSPEPAPICNPDILVADLQNRTSPDDESLEVQLVKANCEG